MKRLLGVLCLLLVVVAPAWADMMSGVVFVVIDGDTVLFKPDSYSTASRTFLKIRLAEIDAPEKDQPYGDAATRALTALLLNQRVEVDTVATDIYGRTIGRIQVGGISANAELVRQGLAWGSSRYRRNAELLAAHRDAQEAQRGLWQEITPVPPWVWRREHSVTVH